MGKVKDGASIPAPAKAGKAASGGSNKSGGWFGAFMANLAARRPLQAAPGPARPARHRRSAWAPSSSLGLLQLYYTPRRPPQDDPARRAGRRWASILGWLVYRVVEYPPFVEFLIATEAEMNKVSWTSRDELKRATTVVLVTVALMAVFLFGVDFLWQFLLKMIGVLRFGDTSDLGSNA